MTDIVVFGEDFGGLPSSTQHIIKHLTENHRILWVNSIGLRQPRLVTKDVKRIVNKLTRSFDAHTQNNTTFNQDCHMSASIQTINLITIPAPRTHWARKAASSMMQHQLKRKLKELGFEKPVLWTSLPTAVDVCKSMDNSGIVYYCGDDFGALAGVDHQTVLEHEEDLIDCCDLILAASEKLAAKFPQDKTVTLPHGVDFTLFSTPAVKANDLPDNGRKILGFYGSLSEWLDYALIEQVAVQAPDWDLVFIGPNELPHNPLPQRTNVHYLGPRAHQQLPSYSQHWDASWLPFVDNAQIKACNPLKLLEYLATGTPVISTTFPALMPYKQMLHVAAGAEDVCASLNHLLPPPIGTMALIEKQSWASRAFQVEQLVRSL
ncbi:glycosyltransferase [Vibrio jasicida]|uniref:Glycosyltransferase n=1 Tax=Vibrio jasicida TaxID=766224 RepID=A0ABW7J4J8_9VIBR